MSVDQTFHTPSFGDDEFEIPPLNYAPTAAASRCSGHGVYGNQVPVEYLKRKLSYDQIYVYLPRQEDNFNDCGIYNQHPITHLRAPETFLHPHQQQHHQQQQQQQQQQQSYHPLQQHPGSPPQDRIMNNNHFQQQQHHHQQQYQQDMMNTHGMGMNMQYDNPNAYSDSMQQGSMQHQQMALMQQPQNQLMGPPQQVYPTINQNQVSSQLGLQIGMGPPHPHGASPPGSNQTSPGLETSEDSDDSTPLAQEPNGGYRNDQACGLYHWKQTKNLLPLQLMGTIKRPSPEPVDTTVPKVTKKPKGPKKKKKRDPNEPQKPVSAYALFFRDTQAAIKGQNPNASFGEVSKIVASMWDSLDVDSKNSYKKKTENAKKEYLKKLAAYRATLVSKAAVDQSDTMYGNNVPNASPPATNSPISSPPGRMMQLQKSPVYASVVDTMQPVANSMNVHPQNQQVWQMQSPQHLTNNNSPPHGMQGGNGMIKIHQPLQMQPQMSPQQQMNGMNTRQQVPQMQVSSPQLCSSASNSPSYNQNMTAVSGGDNQMGGSEMMNSLPTCLRNGCPNPAVDSSDWDREYCSSECVVSHCKDVFAKWVADKQMATSNSSFPVK